MEWIWKLMEWIWKLYFGIIVVSVLRRACDYLRLSASRPVSRDGEAIAGSASSPKTEMDRLLDRLSGFQTKLLDIVASSSSASLERLPPDFPRSQQISDNVYEVCKPIAGRPSVEIVFFHGLQLEGSDEAYITTWVSQDQSQLWLNWLVEDFPNARILIISYDAGAKRTCSKGIMEMYLTRENLVHSLLAASVGQDGCPVVLVGHCLGGLVMKELCVQADSMLSKNSSHEASENLLWNIKGLFFYATPHQGSRIADDAQHMGLLFQDMTVLNTRTARRNEDFRMLRKKFAWRTSGVGENRDVSLGKFRGFVVPEASARYDMDLFCTIDADHFQICRPESKISNSYGRLKTFVAGVLKEDKIRFAPDRDVPADVVGLESQITKVEEMLERKARVGLVGMGGIGKTTLAKAVFYAISGKFEYACFVYKVKLSVTGDEQQRVLRKTISENLYCRGRKVPLPFDWTILKGKRVLIILDDAELDCQADVMTEADGFSPESRLIVTSRDMGFLIPEDFVFHKVRALSLDDSQVLFCLHAFKKRIAPRAYEAKVKEFAKKCGGLPLALKVSGRYLYNRKKHAWDDAFMKLGRAEPLNGSREDGLWSILRVSYDSLAPTEQKMFLDAATAFHREDLVETQHWWKKCGWAVDSGWDNLSDRGLVSQTFGGIEVHEVLRDLGKSIACPDPEDVTTHTRVYDINTANQLCEVLSARRQQEQGTTAKIEVLKLSNCDQFEISVIQGLEHLRILKLAKLRLHGSVDVPPNNLSVVLASGPCNKWGSSVDGTPKALWKLVSVRFLNLAFYDQTPPEGLGRLRALEELVIRHCEWKELPDSIGQLQKLRCLAVVSCHYLRSLPESFGQLRALQVLQIVRCNSFRALPESFGQLRALRLLQFFYCRTFETLPESFGDLCALEWLCIYNCDSFIEPPQSVRKLRALQYLNTDSSTTLEYFGQLETLRVLNIGLSPGSRRHGQFRNLECLRLTNDYRILSEERNHWKSWSFLESLRALKHLTIEKFKGFTDFPVYLAQLVALERLEVIRCENLEALLESVGQLQALECLSVDDCDTLVRLPESIGRLRALRCLEISRCRNLEALPESLGQLQALECLSIDSCDSLARLPESLEVANRRTPGEVDKFHCEMCAGERVRGAYFFNFEKLPPTIIPRLLFWRQRAAKAKIVRLRHLLDGTP